MLRVASCQCLALACTCVLWLFTIQAYGAASKNHEGQPSGTVDTTDGKLDTIRVLGQKQSGIESITQVSSERYTGFSRTLSRVSFENRFTSMSELLNEIPGIQVKQAGGLGSINSVSVRGATGKQINYYLDGLLLNSVDSGTSTLQTIPTAIIEQIQVFPDFAPVQLGGTNIGGAIHFSSRQLKPGDEGGQGSLAAGSFGTQQVELAGWDEINGWHALGVISHSQADNDFDVAEDLFRTPYTERHNDGFELNNIFIKAGRPKAGTADVSMHVLFQHVESDKELATILNRLRDDSTLATSTTRLQSVFDHSSGVWSFGHRMSLIEDAYTFEDPNSNIGQQPNRVKSERQGINWFSIAQRQIGQHDLSFGLDLRHDQLTQKDLLTTSDSVEAERDTANISLGDQWQINDDVLVNTVARYIWINDKADFEAKDKKPSGDISASSLQSGIRWLATEAVTLKANVGSTTRIPSINEKFGARGQSEGNEELEEVRIDMIDAGIELMTSQHRLVSSVYFKSVDNGIYRVVSSQGVSQFQNLRELFIRGVDVDYHWYPLSWLSLNFTASLLDSENNSPVKITRGKKVPGIYHKSYGASLKLFGQFYDFTFRYQREEELFYNPANAVSADDKNDLSTSLTFYINDATLDLTVRNLRDKNFLDFNRLPTPGRSLTLTLSYGL